MRKNNLDDKFEMCRCNDEIRFTKAQLEIATKEYCECIKNMSCIKERLSDLENEYKALRLKYYINKEGKNEVV